MGKQTIREYLKEENPLFVICANANNPEENEGHTTEKMFAFPEKILNCNCYTVWKFGIGKMLIEYYFATKEFVLGKLLNLVGNEFDEDEIICAFGDFEENGSSEVIVKKTIHDYYNAIAYINSEESTNFLFTLDDNNIIVDVTMI